MKKNLLVLLLAGLSYASFAQPQKTIKLISHQVGVDYRTNTPLMANQYEFDLPVYKFFPSPEHQALTVLTRKKQFQSGLWKPRGELMVLDPATGNRKWGKRVDFSTTSLRLTGNVLLEQNGKKLSKLALENGRTHWKRDSYLFRVVSKDSILICYDADARYKTLSGIDLTSGHSLWQRPLDGRMGWKSSTMINDSAMLISAGGLHSIGIKTGSGWDIDRVTHVKKVNMRQVGVALVGGVIGGAIGGALAGTLVNARLGYAVTPTGGFTDYYLHLSSNVLYNGDVFYFAAKEKISCHSLDGKKMWETPLNEKITGISYLYQENNTIYLINKGAGMQYGWLPAAHGVPYVATFDASTGEQLSFKEWTNRETFISDCAIQKNELLLLYPDKVDIHYFAPEGLSQKYVSKFAMEVKMSEFAPDYIFVRQDSSFVRTGNDKEHIHLFSEDYDLYRFTNDFESNEKIPRSFVYRNYLETESYLFLGNDLETYIVDKFSYKKIALLDAPYGSVLSNQKLFYAKENLLFELDVSAWGAAVSIDR